MAWNAVWSGPWINYKWWLDWLYNANFTSFFGQEQMEVRWVAKWTNEDEIHGHLYLMRPMDIFLEKVIQEAIIEILIRVWTIQLTAGCNVRVEIPGLLMEHFPVALSNLHLLVKSPNVAAVAEHSILDLRNHKNGMALNLTKLINQKQWN